MNERLKSFALNRQIQILVAFGVLAGVGYYLYLNNKKKQSEKTF